MKAVRDVFRGAILVFFLVLLAATAVNACDDHSVDVCPVEMTGENPRSRTYCGSAKPSRKAMERMGEAVTHYKEQQANRHARGLTATFNDQTIRVYIHEIQEKKNGDHSLSEEDKSGMIDALNKGFENTGFQFKLTKVDVVVNSKWYVCGNGDNGLVKTFKEKLRRGGRDALNIFVCKLDISGISTFPPDLLSTTGWGHDGVMLKYPSLSSTRLDAYWTLVHEVGHWLGLLHTFTDKCQSSTQSRHSSFSLSWTLAGDGCRDTAAHSGPQWDDTDKTDDGTYLWETCYKDAKKKPNSCGDGTANSIDQGADPYNNFMNYIKDTCMRDYGSFTEDQIERMQAQFNEFRHYKMKDAATKRVAECFKTLKDTCGSRCKDWNDRKCARTGKINKCDFSKDKEEAAAERVRAVEKYDSLCDDVKFFTPPAS